MQSTPSEQQGRQGISLVVAVFNEEENLQPLVAELIEIGLPTAVDLELLFIDDGSTDRSLAIMQELAAAHSFIRVIKHDRNGGKSAGWATGFKFATKEIVVVMDADLQNDPRDILPMLAKLNEGYDIVSGQRRRRADTIFRKLQSRIANHTRRSILHDNALDCGCGLKMIRRSVLTNFFMFNGVHRFMEALVQYHGYRFAHVLVNDRRRIHGVAKYGFRNRALGPLFDMLAVRWMRKRLLKAHGSQVNPAPPRQS